jgi:hypothetical protein
MLSIKTHIVTLRLLSSNDPQVISDYMSRHIGDADAWDAYFQLSPLNPEDSIRSAFKILPENVVKECAIRFAEDVLPIFEKEFPKDQRPRDAIKAAREYIKNPTPENLKKCQAANAATYAAYAATYAAYAADAATYAYAAAYAAANAAANAATYAAAYRRDTQFKIIVDVVKEFHEMKHKSEFLEAM